MQAKADPRQTGRQTHTLDPSVCAGMSYKRHGSSLGVQWQVVVLPHLLTFPGAVLHFQL